MTSDMDEEARLQLLSIIQRISPEDRRRIADLPEDQVFTLHFGLGMGIRNMIRSGELAALYRWSRAQVPREFGDLDEFAWPIVPEVWKVLRSQPRAPES